MGPIQERKCDYGHRQAGTTKIRPYLGSRAAASSRGTSQTGMGVNEELEKDGSPPILKPIKGICQVTPKTVGDPPRKVACPPPAGSDVAERGHTPKKGRPPMLERYPPKTEIPEKGQGPPGQ